MKEAAKILPDIKGSLTKVHYFYLPQRLLQMKGFRYSLIIDGPEAGRLQTMSSWSRSSFHFLSQDERKVMADHKLTYNTSSLFTDFY